MRFLPGRLRRGLRVLPHGRPGVKRNLEAWEIIEQYRLAANSGRLSRDARSAWVNDRQITNVVFMGMGEPLHNLENVVRACRVFNEGLGAGLSPRHIVVSTAGVGNRIRELWQEGVASLAVSLPATTDELREATRPPGAPVEPGCVAPDSARHSLAPPRKRDHRLPAAGRPERHSEDARRLAEWLKDLPAKLNLLEFNPEPLLAGPPSFGGPARRNSPPSGNGYTIRRLQHATSFPRRRCAGRVRPVGKSVECKRPACRRPRAGRMPALPDQLTGRGFIFSCACASVRPCITMRFLREVSPPATETWFLLTPKKAASNSSISLLALPLSGAARTASFNAPPCSPRTLESAAPAEASTSTVTPSWQARKGPVSTSFRPSSKSDTLHFAKALACCQHFCSSRISHFDGHSADSKPRLKNRGGYLGPAGPRQNGGAVTGSPVHHTIRFALQLGVDRDAANVGIVAGIAARSASPPVRTSRTAPHQPPHADTDADATPKTHPRPAAADTQSQSTSPAPATRIHVCAGFAARLARLLRYQCPVPIRPSLYCAPKKGSRGTAFNLDPTKPICRAHDRARYKLTACHGRVPRKTAGVTPEVLGNSCLQRRQVD